VQFVRRPFRHFPTEQRHNPWGFQALKEKKKKGEKQMNVGVQAS
jgi:hypothetical protein